MAQQSGRCITWRRIGGSGAVSLLLGELGLPRGKDTVTSGRSGKQWSPAVRFGKLGAADQRRGSITLGGTLHAGRPRRASGKGQKR